MLTGFRRNDGQCYVRAIGDRADAILWALREAQQGDVVLIAGKGHEDYQEVEGQRYRFDDREFARNSLYQAAEETVGVPPLGNSIDHWDAAA